MSTALPPSVNDRVASGFDWASAMDDLYADGGLWEKATFQSSDSNRHQRAYGATMWQQANVATPLYGMLPKIPAENAPTNLHDPRPMSYRAVFNPPTYDAVGEAGSWQTAKVFDTREVDIDPRHSTILFEGSVLNDVLADIHDGVPFENVTQIGEEYFRRSIEADGIARGVNSGSNSGTTYSATNKVATIDRVVASQGEESSADGVGDTALDDGDLDVYGIDRSQTSDGQSNESNWADAVVNHNSGSDRQLTKGVVNSTIESLEQNGTSRENLVMFTGYDTARVLSELTESQFRADALQEIMREAVGRNADDAETRPGKSFSTQLNKYEGIPIVPGPHVPSDSLSRIYLLDMTAMQDPVTGANIPKIGIETYIPMTVETAGVGQETNTLALGSLLEQQGLFMTHQIRCTRFNHQAKVRDLSE